MNIIRFSLGSVGLIMLYIGVVYADGFGEWFEGHERHEGRSYVTTVNSPLYTKECGSCHFAYQPSWLPARSWKKMMNGLSDHFGDNAEINPEDKATISQYLLAEASDVKVHRKSRKLMRGIGGDTPLRISTLPYIQSKHDEIPSRLITGNAKVGSLANCSACHIQASRGNFGEHGVRIPNYGRWED